MVGILIKRYLDGWDPDKEVVRCYFRDQTDFRPEQPRRLMSKKHLPLL
jgi:hypothetical protein